MGAGPCRGMRWLLPLLAASLLTLAFSLSSAGGRTLPGAGEVGAGGPARTLQPHPDTVPRVGCERPWTLRLRRFEDRSARLECAGRVIVRISVPG